MGRYILPLNIRTVRSMPDEGNVRVEGLSVADRDQGDEVTSLQTLFLNKVLVTVDPTTVSIKEVGLQQPMAHLVVRPDGGLNLGRLAVVRTAIGFSG